MSPGWFPLPTASSSIGFWPSMPASPREWFSSRPGSPSVAPYHDLLSALSCPTSPLLGRSNPPPESPGHATLSGVGRKLRSLGSSGNDVREASPPPSRAMSPILRPITPLVQALGMDNWAPERDPTEGIDVIEIMVTKEIIVHYGSVGEAAA
ncbi:hypothetical protein BC834DRAFT_972211 [Gloeopeniophorella convolvens]|nr:hypothetical protein BC834DRAFT_972211 [Gloeopeniophorella convolvens]